MILPEVQLCARRPISTISLSAPASASLPTFAGLSESVNFARWRGRTTSSSGKPRCGHLLTELRNPSGVCQMMRSRYLVLCGSEITKPRVCSSSTALAGQMTVPLGGNHRSCTSRHTARPACRGRGQSPTFCTRASTAPVTLVARRGANLLPAPCRRVSAHF